MARGASRGRTAGRFRAVLALSALCAGWPGLASAASDAAPPDYPAPIPPSPGWEISATPYLWVPGLKGDAGVSSALPSVGLDFSSGDILDLLHFGLMGQVDARHDRVVAAADAFYVDLRAEKGLAVHDREF